MVLACAAQGVSYFAGDAKSVFHGHTTDILPARFPSMLEPRHDLTFTSRPLCAGRLPPPGAIVMDHKRNLGETICARQLSSLVGAALATHTWSTSPSFNAGCSPTEVAHRGQSLLKP
jgi:hypothetical protein